MASISAGSAATEGRGAILPAVRSLGEGWLRALQRDAASLRPYGTSSRHLLKGLRGEGSHGGSALWHLYRHLYRMMMAISTAFGTYGAMPIPCFMAVQWFIYGIVELHSLRHPRCAGVRQAGGPAAPVSREPERCHCRVSNDIRDEGVGSP